MKFGFSGEAFGNLLVLNAIIVVIGLCAFFFIAHRRGVDVSSRRLHLKVLIVSVGVFLIIPLWLTDLTIKWKAIITLAGVAAGAANYFGLDMIKHKLTGERK